MAGKKLLVADDSLTIQKVIRLALSNEGYEIQAVSDGNDASQQMNLFRPDVVLIDVSLPGKSAFEVKRDTNQQPHLKNIRFILMSSAFEKIDEAQANETGFQGRLTKPFDPAHLRQVLTDVLSARTPGGGSGYTPPELGTDPKMPGISDLPEFPKLPDEIPSTTSLDDLWSQEPNVTDSHMDLQPPPLPGSGFDPDSDIRELTASTIKMSGLDDLQWSVNETARKSDLPLTPPPLPGEPSMPPHDAMMDHGNTTFKLDENLHPSYRDESTRPSYTPPIEFEPRVSPPPPPPPAMPGDFPDSNVLPITTGQMEDLIHKQLQETLEKMAMKILPEIAERVIKSEINRLLNEQA